MPKKKVVEKAVEEVVAGLPTLNKRQTIVAGKDKAKSRQVIKE